MYTASNGRLERLFKITAIRNASDYMASVFVVGIGETEVKKINIFRDRSVFFEKEIFSFG